jgi:hypothetical protein
MLTVYLDGLSVLVCLRLVFCVSNVDSLSRWIVCSGSSSSCVLCIQC